MNRMFALALMTLLVATATFGKNGRSEKNKAIVRKVFIDIWTQGKYEVANEIYAKDFVNHGAEKDIGFEQDQADIRGWRAAFPDIELFIEKEFAEGDFVTVLWRGEARTPVAAMA